MIKKNFHKLFYASLLATILASCNSGKRQNEQDNSKIIDSSKTYAKNLIDAGRLTETDSAQNEMKASLIHGNLNLTELSKYYPYITDTIKDVATISAHKLDLNPGNGILVSLLHNSAVFDQMFLCTHNKNFNLIDKLYIGKATDFDDGKSHTIEIKIKNSAEVVFEQLDWGYVKKGEEEEIDTVKHEIWTVRIDRNGLIKNKKSVFKKN